MCVFYPLNFKVSRLIAHAAGNRTDGNEARRKSITVACKFLLPFLKTFSTNFRQKNLRRKTGLDGDGRHLSLAVPRGPSDDRRVARCSRLGFDEVSLRI